MSLLEKIYTAFLQRGSEVDDPQNDELYLKLERCLIIEISLIKEQLLPNYDKYANISASVELEKERDMLLKDLEIT